MVTSYPLKNNDVAPTGCSGPRSITKQRMFDGIFGRPWTLPSSPVFTFFRFDNVEKSGEL